MRLGYIEVLIFRSVKSICVGPKSTINVGFFASCVRMTVWSICMEMEFKMSVLCEIYLFICFMCVRLETRISAISKSVNTEVCKCVIYLCHA